ncbi:MAG: calycin-like domain-containing protein [Bacteroidaceae bacterium]|nr:calycin-like domain-containing protein [Bacteroidaceae bacterium]
MKQLYVIIIFAAAFTLASCGDDDEELGYTPTAIGDNSHTADSHQTEPDEDKGELYDTYTGLLQVTVNGESNTPTEQTISIEKTDEEHINFILKNFMLASGDDLIPVGTIKLENIALQQQGSNIIFTVSQDIYIQAGDAQLSTEWLGPLLGAVPVELKGIGNKDQLDIDIDINMVSLNQVIHVDFYTENK